MVQPVRFRIRGSKDGEAPTVDDFAGQLRDLIGIIKGVERASGDGENLIEWRVTRATTNSPIAIEATPFPREAGVNIEARALNVKAMAAAGLASLQSGAERPVCFDQDVLACAKRLAGRVSDGLAETVIDWGDEAGEFNLTAEGAGQLADHVATLLRPHVEAYTERGTVEGYHDGLHPHTRGRHELFIRSRRTGQRIKCILTTEAARDIARREIAEVFSGRRLQVRGTLHYRRPHDLDHIQAEHVRVMPDRQELPDLKQIIDPDFTGGLGTEDYLRALRNGRLR
ncbi:hypothetical protein P7L74_10260 [Tistrella mobilis]|uniref:hypothetical protein n=1 Tax=Tistrella mobilis TaxID=171437 RepID=UPI00355661CE